MFASKLDVSDGRLAVTREVDGGLEMINVRLPCVVSADLRRVYTLDNLYSFGITFLWREHGGENQELCFSLKAPCL